MEEAEILFEERGAVGLVILNRPKALNALTRGMCTALHAKLKEWATKASVKAVVLRGAGDRAFCAGGDIRVLYEKGKAGDPYAIDFYRDEYRLNAFIHHFPKPYVSLLDGITMGGGVGVSVHGSHRIATEKTVFAMPETGIGFFPDVGGTYFLPRCPGQIGMYLGLTGARIAGADALYAGVATHFVARAQLDGLTEALAAGTPLDAALARFKGEPGPAALAERRTLIDHYFAKRSLDEIVQSLAQSDDPWAAETLATLKTKSPTALKVVYRQICEGARADMDECMRIEFRMVNRFMAEHDFYEGVRAVIIDKDQKPQWRPAALDAVTPAMVEAYFTSLGSRDLPLP